MNTAILLALNDSFQNCANDGTRAICVAAAVVVVLLVYAAWRAGR